MAEKVKLAIGSAFPLKEELTIDVRGRNLVTGLPEAIEISSVEVREALSSSISVIIKTIRDALDEAPPEIISDLLDNGVCLAGGSSNLKNLAERLSNDLRVRVWVAEDSMTCVARGCGIILENKDEFESFLVGVEREPTKRTLS